MDTLYIVGAILLVLGIAFIIAGYAVRKKHPALGWVFLCLGLVLLIAATIMIDTHFNRIKAAAAFIRLNV